MLGHESCNLIKYLEGFEGVAPIKRGHNPATWMLEVTGGATSTGVKASKIDFPAAYKVTLPPHCVFFHVGFLMATMLPVVTLSFSISKLQSYNQVPDVFCHMMVGSAR